MAYGDRGAANVMVRAKARADTPKTQPGEFLVALYGWIIPDGNYQDFAVGDRLRFALEFQDLGLARMDRGVRSIIARGDGTYDVAASIAHASKQIVMLDFGLLAYAHHSPPTPRVGAWLTGRVSLAVDDFSYFEFHAKRRSVPQAVYTWTITGVWQDTPHRIPDVRELVYGKRDTSITALVPLERTGDVDGYTDYLIRCRLEDEPATHGL